MRKSEKWSVAYRIKNNQTDLMDNKTEPFIPIKNTWRYWRADPFLFEYEGKTYLFAELYDRVLLRGVIGCCEIGSWGVGNWNIVLKEPFHLSYPFVFQHKDGIYMIPESFRSGRIILYKASVFPWKWEMVQDIADMVAVDSTIVEGADGMYMITFRIVDGEAELIVVRMDDQMRPLDLRVVSRKEDPNVRPAGKVFLRQEAMYRPAQDCTRGYGWALNFYQIRALNQDRFEEILVQKVLPDQVRIQSVNKPQGLHTYNSTAEIEVIDYKEYELGLVNKLSRLCKIVKNLCSCFSHRCEAK